MIVSLITARIVLNALGAEDRGVYETVASFVSMMALLTNALSTSVSRFLTVEIAKDDKEALRRVFATANGMLLLICAAVLLVGEPLGIWYIDNVMNLPEGRTEAARWVFQFSLFTFLVNLLAIPYNASIFAHERMGVYAVIGLVEGVLKLGVAFALLHAPFDRLIYYAMLLLAVAVIVRSLYMIYCRRNFPESRAGVRLDRAYVGSIFSFAGWNGLSQGIYIFNSHGLTQLLNYFFGVVFNTMRGLALNVENMIKMLVTNVTTAINPQITKSYTSGDYHYCSELVCKGSKYAFLIGFTLSLPFFFEADSLLHLWLGNREVPGGTDLFTRLGLVCMLLDITLIPFNTYVQATGKIKRYYLMYSAVTALVFPVTWLLYRSGSGASSLYFVFMADYLLLDAMRLLMSGKVYGFPLRVFWKNTLLPLIPVALVSIAVTYLVWAAVHEGWWRLVAVLLAGTVSVAISTYAFAMTAGEKSFVRSKIGLK